MSLLSTVTDGLRGEARLIPWTVASLVAIWLVAWAAGYMWVYEVSPVIAATAEKAEQTERIAEDVKGDLGEIKASLLEQSIFQLKTKQCDSATAEARRFYAERLTSLLTEYQRANGRQYPLPPCEGI